MTCGVANEVDSYVRTYFSDSSFFVSKEKWPILSFDKPFSSFSARGDSGSLVVDAEGWMGRHVDWRVGLLHFGSGHSLLTVTLGTSRVLRMGLIEILFAFSGAGPLKVTSMGLSIDQLNVRA